MKPALPADVRQRVLDLRRTHSLREVAVLTGLALGTVKTICTRSGAFRDNPAHRALFTLPPVQHSASTSLVLPEVPQVARVTDDEEVDMLLWLRTVIATGEPGNIKRALQAAGRIKTPMKELEQRYMDFIKRTQPGNFVAALFAMDVGDLDALARRSIDKANKRAEALARFGSVDALFDDVAADHFCGRALDGMEPAAHAIFFDDAVVAALFRAHPGLMPHTLADCLHELAFWDELSRLRSQFDGENPMPSCAREGFVFGLLATIRPRSRQEAVDVLRYLAKSDRMESSETEAILGNLIGGV